MTEEITTPEPVARQLISRRVVVVHPEQRLAEVAERVRSTDARDCVVVDPATGGFAGRVSLQDVAAHAGAATRIFADLLSGDRPLVVRADASSLRVLEIFQNDPRAAVVVVDEKDRYVGLVSLESAWGWMIARQGEANEQLRQLLAEHTRLGDFLERKLDERTAAVRQSLDDFKSSTLELSHDMRGGLRSIKAFADILDESCVELERLDTSRRIKRAVTNLERMADEILTRTKEAFPAAPVSFSGVDLNEIFADTLEFLHALLEARQAKVVQRAPLHTVAGRYTALLQIMANLIANAVKYVPADRTPRIEVWSEMREGQVILFVKDNGRGISAQDREAVFRPFVRIDPGNSAGDGLGLAITRNAVTRLGGDISIESEVGLGSVFVVTLNRG